MKTLILSILSIFASFSAFAQTPEELAKASTVKVTSGLCGQEETKFQGSGVLVSYQNKVYVLTSNHVLINGNGTFCHRIKNSVVGSARANLIASDWSAGLALLEIQTPSAKMREASNHSLRQSLAKESEALAGMGFPYSRRDNSDQESYSSTGYVLHPASSRHWLGNAVPMTETMDLHGEFGMSGGPVYSADYSKIAGILSHQALEMVPGRPSQIRDFSEPTSVGKTYNHIFVIPSDFVLTWMKGILDQSITPALVEVASEQFLGKHVVVSGVLAFRLATAAQVGAIGGEGGGHGSGIGGEGGGHGSGIGGEGGGHGSGIGGEGGGHGSGIGGEGGGHGSGIGGSESSDALTGNDLVISVELSPLGYSTQNAYENERWYKDIKRNLLLTKKVYIPFYVVRDENSLAPIRYNIESLEQFFRALADKGTAPVSQVVEPKSDSKKSSSADASGAPETLKNSVKEALSIVDRLTQTTRALEEKQLLARLKVTLDILSSLDWANISYQEVAQLADGSGSYSQAWTQLFDSVNHAKYDDAIKLMRALDDLTDTVKHSH